jgi:hypothetical protein
VIIAYDLATRRERWRYFDARNGSAGFKLLIAEGRVVVPFVGAGLVSLDLRNGHEQWRTQELHGMVWPPVSAGGRLFAASTGVGLLSLAN